MPQKVTPVAAGVVTPQEISKNTSYEEVQKNVTDFASACYTAAAGSVQRVGQEASAVSKQAAAKIVTVFFSLAEGLVDCAKKISSKVAAASFKIKRWARQQKDSDTSAVNEIEMVNVQ